MRRLLTYLLLPSLFGLFTLSSFAYQYGPVKPGETLWSIAKKCPPKYLHLDH
uniref:LysM peptidoglycan-binding domain-containing protein n=1 Tax=Piscirickettsia litoralis TaxID=1891921 RepID=UPI0013019B6B